MAGLKDRADMTEKSLRALENEPMCSCFVPKMGRLSIRVDDDPGTGQSLEYRHFSTSTVSAMQKAMALEAATGQAGARTP